MTSPATIGDRVRNLRLALGMSQTELAALTWGENTGNKLISQIENGRHEASADLVTQLASSLRCEPSFLTRPAHDVVATRPWLRAYADANARVVESVVADNLLAHEAIQALSLRRIPDHIPLFDGDLNDEHAIDEFAGVVREAAGLDDGDVVRNVMRAADRLGCVVLPLTSELGRHLGLSHRIDGTPFVRISRPGSGPGGVPGDRQRLTVAHEIGHLCLHAELPPPDTSADARRIERQAHRFAGAFLAPEAPLMEDFDRLGGRVTLTTLQQLKGLWGIAIKALVIRFQQIGTIEADQATSLYKQISKRGWNKSEPVPVTPEEPVWMRRALQQRVTLPDVGHLAGLDRSIVSGWLDWSPVDQESEDALPVHVSTALAGIGPHDRLAKVVPIRRGLAQDGR